MSAWPLRTRDWSCKQYDDTMSSNQDAATVRSVSRRNLLVGALLFLASAGFVLWQNTRVAVLWDLSFLLDSAWRLRLGQVPYRELPFSYAPLTFLVHAGLIRVFGRVYWPHLTSAALADGAATMLAWRLLARVLSPLAAAEGLAVLLAVPLCVLGINGIYPHPVYDSEGHLAVLVALWMVWRAVDRVPVSPVAGFVAGAACVVPVFFKQNIGLPFTAAAGCVLVLLAALRTRDRESATYLWILAGMGVAFAAALGAIAAWAGLGNYIHWTIRFAAQRRLPGPAVLLGVFHEPSLVWSLPMAAGGWWVLKRTRWGGTKGGRAVAVVLLTLPFLRVLLSPLWLDDAGDRAEVLLSLWPWMLVLSLCFAMIGLRGRFEFRTGLPWILLATIAGTLLSQQVWGSTYAIWPLFVLLMALVLIEVLEIARPVALVVCVALVVSGGLYATSHERLGYIHLEGEREAAGLRELRGMETPGPWLPGFTELARFTQAEIPEHDGILLLPGEDPFYFATGRAPAFPVLLFDPATDPYTAEETRLLAQRTGIRWLVVKREMQLTAPPHPELAAITAALLQDFVLYRTVAQYDVYKRRG
jgi:hypothetical protein